VRGFCSGVVVAEGIDLLGLLAKNLETKMHKVFVTNDKSKTELQIRDDYTLISNFAVLTEVQVETLIDYVRNAVRYCGRVAVLVLPEELNLLPQAILQNAEVIDQTKPNLAVA
jgi:hypothetical protein